MVTQPLTRNLLLLLFQNSLSVVESHPTIVAERPVQGIQEVYRYAILPLSHGAGWSSSVARRAHNPKVTGSNPVPATIESPVTSGAFLLGSNGLEVVLPTRCPQESVQIHSVRSLPVLLRLPLARDGVVSEASSRYSLRADSGGGVPPWESAQPCNGPRALRPASAAFLLLTSKRCFFQAPVGTSLAKSTPEAPLRRLRGTFIPIHAANRRYS